MLTFPKIIFDAIAAHYMMFLIIIAIAWVIHFINISLNHRLSRFGIIPRKAKGLIGIIFCPFLHGDANHLIINSFMFFMLGLLLAVNGLFIFTLMSILIVILSGLLTWGLGRNAIHIGASSVIMGYWGYLLVQIFMRPSQVNIAIGAVCLIQFGQLVFSLLPGEKKVSWEGHLCGFLSGVFLSYYYDVILTMYFDIQNLFH